MTDAESTMQGLTHVREDGSAHMVDVSDKAVTKRIARAEGFLITRADVVQQLVDGALPKGEALGTARSAGLAVAGVSLRLDAGQAAPGAVSTLLAALGNAVPLPSHAASRGTVQAAG